MCTNNLFNVTTTILKKKKKTKQNRSDLTINIIDSAFCCEVAVAVGVVTFTYMGECLPDKSLWLYGNNLPLLPRR